MGRAWLRTIARYGVAIALAVTVWLVASPARASTLAPQCDERGATTFAPAPTLIPQETSIEQTDVVPACMQALLEGGVEEGAAPAPSITWTAPEPSVVTELPAVHPAAFAPVVAPAERTFVPPAGVRARVERPPR